MTIILIHGAGHRKIVYYSMFPLQKYLKEQGLDSHVISYDNSKTLDECVTDAYLEIKKIVPENDEVILIGQSLGGVVSIKLHERGMNVVKLITIVSPVRGSWLCNKIKNSILGYSSMFRTPFHDLAIEYDKEFTKPDIDVHSITTSWPGTSFDGCVFIDEGTVDEDTHHHIGWSDHRLLFIDGRLFKKVHDILSK